MAFKLLLSFLSYHGASSADADLGVLVPSYVELVWRAGAAHEASTGSTVVLASEDVEWFLADAAIVAVLIREPFHYRLIGIQGQELHVVFILPNCVVVNGTGERDVVVNGATRLFARDSFELHRSVVVLCKIFLQRYKEVFPVS